MIHFLLDIIVSKSTRTTTDWILKCTELIPESAVKRRHLGADLYWLQNHVATDKWNILMGIFTYLYTTSYVIRPNYHNYHKQFRLQPVYFYLLLYKHICTGCSTGWGNSNEYQQLMHTYNTDVYIQQIIHSIGLEGKQSVYWVPLPLHCSHSIQLLLDTSTSYEIDMFNFWTSR